MRMKTLVMATLALGLGTAGAFAVPTEKLWIHIHVKDGKDGNVSINLPVSMVEKMAGRITADSTANSKGNSRLRFNGEDITVAELRDMWNELRKQPDATFITVDDMDSKVRVAKRGGYLIVRSRGDRAGGDEEVEMKIPGTVVDALFSAPGEQLDVAAAMRALARHGEGELMTVSSTGETVRIWVDDTSETR
jgi:hypothetical protein